ncbi:MAG: hypothetical protein K2J65_02200 [Duncaniella sp.]|nr:hypothetical protein [Duncaniella sp.]
MSLKARKAKNVERLSLKRGFPSLLLDRAESAKVFTSIIMAMGSKDFTAMISLIGYIIINAINTKRDSIIIFDYR